MNSLMRACNPDSAVMKAWREYQQTEDYANALRWVTEKQRGPDWASMPEHLYQAAIGSLWAAFSAGFFTATERAAMLHESTDVASNTERLAKVPGADAMGAVIRYRDLIRENVS